MPTCRGRKAGELQRKTAGTFTEPVAPEAPCRAGGRRAIPLPCGLCLPPSFSKLGKELKATAIPGRLMRRRTRGSVWLTAHPSQQFLPVPITVHSASPN